MVYVLLTGVLDMAGSGKWIRIASGKLSFGNNNSTYAEMYSSKITNNSKDYLGMTIDCSHIALTGLTEFSIADVKGYTGVISMCTDFYTPYDCLIWDPTSYNINNVRTAFQNYRFVHGFCVGVS